MTVVQFTGGKRCKDCDEQIPPRRLRAQPKARRCTDCQDDRDKETLRTLSNYAVGSERGCNADHSVVIIRA